jgi:anti-sigma regulatory factor (Ser/Thr protein kinase)
MTFPPRHVSISIPIAEMSGVGEARRVAMSLARSLQFSESDAGRVGVVVTEAATNIVQHARHGEILLRPYAFQAPPVLELLALDKGPGMENVAEAMRDGFSTGGSRGVGLGAIARLATTFEVFSSPGLGTALLARLGRQGEQQQASQHLDYGVVCVPKRGEDASGDAWSVVMAPGRSAILVVDGLGHGSLAFDAAREALRIFEAHPEESPVSLLKILHAGLRGSQGAVAAIADIDWSARDVRFAGAGNIGGTLLPDDRRSAGLVSHAGTLGHSMTHFQEFHYPWPDHGHLILHSDGLSSRWTVEPYPGLRRKDPSIVAGVLYRDFASRTDDVVVLVAREKL